MNTLPDTIHAQHFHAMGCQISIWLELDNPAQAAELLMQAETIFNQTEQRLTRFCPTSELSQLNARPEEWVVVSNGLWHVVRTAIIFASETDGLFDPTVLTAIEVAGYRYSFEEINASQPSSDSCGQSHEGRWQDVQFDQEKQAIRLPVGVGIDLGGIGKGWTAALVVAALEEFGPCLVDAAGDLTAGDAPQGWPGWPVSIAKPGHNDTTQFGDANDTDTDNLARLWLRHESLATSGVDYRRWAQNGQEVHHLIDPATGLPADTDMLTVSVLDRHACRAEAWATAAMVAGKSRGFSELNLRQFAAAGTAYDAQGEIKLTLTPAIRPRIYM